MVLHFLEEASHRKGDYSTRCYTAMPFETVDDFIDTTTKFPKKLKNMAKNQPTIDAFMDRRWSSEYHFLSKLYNKLLHRPTNDVVNFRGRGWLSGCGRGNECPTIRGPENLHFCVLVRVECEVKHRKRICIDNQRWTLTANLRRAKHDVNSSFNC